VASLPPQNLTQQSGPITCLASDLSRACRKYGCTVQCIIGLHHSPPQMKNQHRLNEEKTLIRKNDLSIEVSDVTRMDSLGTNNQG
jgi:hypothetical protein